MEDQQGADINCEELEKIWFFQIREGATLFLCDVSLSIHRFYGILVLYGARMQPEARGAGLAEEGLNYSECHDKLC